MNVRRSSAESLLRTPKATMTPFDREVTARRESKVKEFRDAASSEALAFLDAEPVDAAGPLKDAAKGEEAAVS